jgi:alkylhydroperoxidase family enzyme
MTSVCDRDDSCVQHGQIEPAEALGVGDDVDPDDLPAGSVCVEMHAQDLKKGGETDQRLFAVAAWREAPYFTDAERAALALTEAATRLSDRADPVPDEIWDEAARHYDERALSALIIAIANINVWNRLNVTTRQVAGSVGG